MPTRYREILSHAEMCVREGFSLQKGMNFRTRGGASGYSVILMSVRKGAPYQDRWHDSGVHAGQLEYEGHDRARRKSEWPRGRVKDPKKVDQPMRLASGGLSDNGKFFEAADEFKAGNVPAEVVQVYEKIVDGVWADRGRYELVDAVLKSVPLGRTGKKSRQVFRFFLKPTPPSATPGAEAPEEARELSIGRQIPTAVKVAVWKRDGGRCVQCGATDNLHFDHDVPYSKGGSSITEENVKLLCVRHNLQKSDKIISLGPLLGSLVAAALAGAMRGA